jgi:Helix-hairpin-helix motif
MDKRSLWVTIGFLLLLVYVGPFGIVAFLYDLGLYPATTEEQVVTEMKRRSGVHAVTCRNGSPDWDFVCDFEVQARGGPSVRHREGIETSYARAILRAVPLPVDGPVLTEAQAAQWREDERKRRQDEQKKMSGPVNVRTATVAELRRIPLVDQYRAQEIHAAVRYGLVRKLDDLLKIQGIDQTVLNVMRTRAVWE